MKKILIIFIVFGLLISGKAFAQEENKLTRYNNISIYQQQNDTAELYKLSLYTSLTKGTWFLSNVFDNFLIGSRFKQNWYYSLSTLGKYITKKISIRCQFEKSKNNPSKYYVGIGIDF